jgi:peptidoglycan/LPS O-acetylase OafA/YrhL
VPALDGLRGVAILLVVLDHAGAPGFEVAGDIGVTLFFVLSGYLITGVLLAEHEGSGRIRLRRFYSRRARRLLPALAPMLAVTLLIWGRAAASSAVATILYVANVVQSQPGGPLHPALHHMWSLSVEEQFYLAWPAILIVLLARGSRSTLAWTLALGALVGVAVRLVGYSLAGYWWAYHATLPSAFTLLVGAWLAVTGARFKWPAIAFGALLVVVITAGWIGGATSVILASVLAAALAGCLVSDAPTWLGLRPLAYFGRISYGWYLWHTMFIMLLGGPLGAAVGLAVAAASWHWWERWWIGARSGHTDGEHALRIDGRTAKYDAGNLGLICEQEAHEERALRVDRDRPPVNPAPR